MQATIARYRRRIGPCLCCVRYKVEPLRRTSPSAVNAAALASGFFPIEPVVSRSECMRRELPPSERHFHRPYANDKMDLWTYETGGYRLVNIYVANAYTQRRQPHRAERLRAVPSKSSEPIVDAGANDVDVVSAHSRAYGRK